MEGVMRMKGVVLRVTLLSIAAAVLGTAVVMAKLEAGWETSLAIASEGGPLEKLPKGISEADRAAIAALLNEARTESASGALLSMSNLPYDCPLGEIRRDSGYW